MSAYTDAVLADGPVAYWRLGEIFGSVARDSSGAGRNLSINGGVTLGSSPLQSADGDPAMSFDGTTGYLEAPYSAALNPPTFSIEILLAPASLPAGNATLISSRDLGNNLGWILFLQSGGNLNLRVGTGGTFLGASGGNLAIGGRHHAVATYDGTSASLWLDGVQVAGPVAIAFAPNLSQVFRIARDSSGANWYAGPLDEAALYSHVLSPARIAAHFAAMTAGAVVTQGPFPRDTESVGIPVVLPGGVGGISTAPAAYTAFRYTYLFVDLVSNTIIGEFPLSNVRWGRVLNGAGSFTGSLKISDPRIAAANPLSATQPGRTALYVDRDGVLVWGGIIWTRRYQSSSQTLELGGNEFWSYFARRRIRDLLAYAGVDQLAIAQGIITNLQSKPGGNIGVTVGSEVSGVLRAQTYNPWDLKPGATAIEQLSALQGGFDFAIDVAYAGGVPSKQLVLSYPRRGALASQTGVFFELPGNVTDYTYPEDASTEADTMYAIGAGQGSSMLLSTAGRPDLIAAGYPLLEDTSSYTDVIIQATLDAHALADVGSRANPIILPEVTVAASIDPVLGSYSVGDDSRIRITDPRHNLGWDPVGKAWLGPGLDTYYRIIAYDVTVPETGYETVVVRLGPTG